MSVQKQIDNLLAQRASEWVDLLRQGRAEDLEAFASWIAESPRHVDEFLSLAAVDRELESRALYADVDREALLKQIRPAVTTLVPATSAREAVAASRKSGRPWQWIALAAGIATLGALGFMAREVFSPARTFRTTIGEQRSIELPDGSRVQLNARSSMTLAFDADRREVRLTQGEALFKVAKDVTRPFEVRTRDAVVRAVGTQFNVASRESGTRVTVLEGRVQVSAAQDPSVASAALSAGDVAQLVEKRRIQVMPHTDVTNEVAWRQRRLVFVKAPLEQIVSEFNRFNARTLRLKGVAGGSRHYSGTFDADDPEALIAFLEHEQDLSVEVGREEIVIREARAGE